MIDYQKLLNSNIKKLRKTSGLTQEKFAELTDLSVDAIRNIEQNKYTPTASTINSICSALKITPFEMLLPDASVDENLILEINSKLKLCTNDDLRRISKMIDVIRK